MSTNSSSSTPSPVFAVPYSKNRDFTGRLDILELLKRIFGNFLYSSDNEVQTRSALYGLGGNGKSQIAIDFAYWISKQAPAISVFWVHAGTFERFREDFQAISEICKIPERRESKANILQVVHDWLRNKEHGRWLLVVDNADDGGLFFRSTMSESQLAERKPPPLSEYLPECTHGALLFTTRDQRTAGCLTQQENLLKVDEMSENDAQALLRRKLKTTCDPGEVSRLARSLEHLPLALVQAASYIQRPGMSISKYMELLKSDAIALLSKPSPAAGRVPDIPNALASTWLITFKYLRTNFYVAWRMFALMSFLDSQAIPKSILRIAGKDGLELEEALGHLISFSLLNERKEDSSRRLQDQSQGASGLDECFDMHPLVRLVTQEWLKSENKAKVFANEMFSLLARAYPFDDGNPSWATYDLYEPHVVVMLKCVSDRETRGTRANLQGKRGRMFLVLGLAKDAVECFEEVVGIVKELSGPEHADTLRTTFDLIHARSPFCDPWENLHLCNQTLKKTIEVQSTNSIVTRLGAMTMAECLRLFSFYEDILVLTIFVMESHRKSMGSENGSYLALEDAIAAHLLRSTQYEKAEQILESQLQRRTQKLGKGHWKTLDTMHTLWLLYHSTDRPREAEAIEQKRIDVLEEQFGPEHHLVMDSRYSLALVYADLEQWDKAAELAELVLRASIRIRGLRDPVTFDIKQFLCVLALLRNLDQEAIEMQSDLVRVAEETLGKSSISVLWFAHRLRDWQQEESRILYRTRWNEGWSDRRTILKKASVAVYGPELTNMTGSHEKIFRETDQLIDTLLRGHQRSSISYFLWGTLGSIRRNRKRLWERNPDISPDLSKVVRPAYVLAPWCRRLLRVGNGDHKN